MAMVVTLDAVSSNGIVRTMPCHSTLVLTIFLGPKMAEKLLLHIHYECTRHKISLPWDTIAHRLHPGSSGAAIQQHFNRLRRELLSEGHLVPPLGSKPGAGTVDVEVRGFVRVEDGNPGETRPVKFSETVDDPRFTIPDSFEDDKEPIEDCTYASNSAPSQSPSVSPPTPMFGEMSQANMTLRSVYGSQFDRAVATGAAANTFPQGIKYTEVIKLMASYSYPANKSQDLFPTEVVNAGLASGGLFHEVAPSSYLTPMRGQRYFDAISPMDSPYLHMGGHTFSFAREPVELSPVELPGQSTAADTEVSLAHIIEPLCRTPAT